MKMKYLKIINILLIFVIPGALFIPGMPSSNLEVQASTQDLPVTANVDIQVKLPGGSRPDSGWSVPLTVKLFTPGTTTPTDVLTTAPVYEFNLTTTKQNGFASAQASGIEEGSYDVSATSPHCLVNVVRGVNVASPSTLVDLGPLSEGNANNDDRVDIHDFGILAAAYGSYSGQSKYNSSADFDRNGIINIADFGLLVASYGKISPLVRDNTPPTITSVNPPDEFTDVTLNTTVSAVFSEAMKASTVNTSSFTLSTASSPVAGSVTYGGDTATFTPSVTLSPDTRYTANISTNVKDLAGNAMTAGRTWNFTTAALPRVVSVSPQNGNMNVPSNAVILVKFSKDINEATISPTSFIVKQGNSSVQGNLEYDGYKITFTPAASLEINKAYSVTITTDIKDTQGLALANNYVWSFATSSSSTTVSILNPVFVPNDPEKKFTVEVHIANVSDLAGFQFWIEFNDSVVQLDSPDDPQVDPGEVGGDNFPMNYWSEGASIKVLGGPGDPMHGQGYLAKIHFKAVGASGQTSSLTFKSILTRPYFQTALFDKWGMIIPCNFSNGSVTVP